MLIRHMVKPDVAAVIAGNRTTDHLDHDGSYTYRNLLLNHPDANIVALDDDGDLMGYVAGYFCQNGDQFIWQLFTAEAHHRKGVASAMLDHLIEANQPARLKATVERGNRPSMATFESAARRHGATIIVSDLYTPEDSLEEVCDFEDLVMLVF